MGRLGLVLVGLALTAVAGVPALHAQTFQERLTLCLACHGEKGQSETADVPSLGGQPPLYILIQLYMFREKQRVAAPMNDMADGLSDADLQKFADLMAKLPPPAAREAVDPARAARAHALIVQNRCAFCHSVDFSGNESVPRLAAQREDYLLKSLREYKSGERREYQPIMVEVMRALNDGDIAELAYFLARTGPR